LTVEEVRRVPKKTFTSRQVARRCWN